MNKTDIQWTDRTWNPVSGCSHVSEGCRFCYAERLFSRPYPGRKFTDVRCHPERLDQPLRIKKPQKIFINSMSDLFHEDVPDEFIDQVFAVMALSPHHTYQLLSKRPERMCRYVSDKGRCDSILREIWRIRNRQRGADMEGPTSRRDAKEQGVQGIHQPGRRKAMQESEGGISNKGRLPLNLDNDKQEEDCHGRTSGNLGVPQWTPDSGGAHHKPQERTQGGELAGQSGAGNLFRTAHSRPDSAQCEQESPQRISPSKNKDTRDGCIGNSSAQGFRSNDQNDCHGLRHEEKSDICDMQSTNMEARIAYPLPNVWLGISCEDQKTADERIPILLQTPAAVRFLSCEPLLGPIDLWGKAFLTQAWSPEDPTGKPMWSGLDWLIVGGESGPRARPMDPAWVRAIRDQCVAAGVPFFFKQWGEWAPVPGSRKYEPPHGYPIRCSQKLQYRIPEDGVYTAHAFEALNPDAIVLRIGKKAAGHLLDGKAWQEFPA